MKNRQDCFAHLRFPEAEAEAEAWDGVLFYVAPFFVE
jgi:hypothetical protein